MAGHFHFRETSLTELPGKEYENVRPVNPGLAHLTPMIPVVGAAVIRADLDDDGLAKDVLHVDPRSDRVVVGPAPGTGRRYLPFDMDAAPLEYRAEATAPMGTLVGDFDEDGRPDVLVYYWGRSPIVFLRVRGTERGQLGRQLFGAHDLVDPVRRWYTIAATSADLDGDGHLDLVLGQLCPDGARVLDPSARAADELQNGRSRAANGGSDRLFLWKPGVDGPGVAP